MWIANATAWNASHTDLSKYYIERLKQKLDPSEIISNKHKTTNGITLINEIIEVSTATLKRIKNVTRLKRLLEEAKNRLLDTNIVNDYIIVKYHADIADFFQKIDTETLVDRQVPFIQKKCKIFLLRLNAEYFENIQTEFKAIDFTSRDFNRNALLINRLLDCLIPYLLYSGYSITSLSDIAYAYVFKPNGSSSATRFLTRFRGLESSCQICLTIPKNYAPEVRYLLEELARRGVTIVETSAAVVNLKFPPDKQLQLNSDDYSVYKGSFRCADPHNYIRSLYDNSLRNYVISRDRITLSFFTDFFENIYWRFSREIGPSSHNFDNTNVTQDPISVKKRPNTLANTLTKISPDYNLNFDRATDIPNIPQINDSLYYYNLAIRSKSLENSFFLLWTSLETLVPYKFKENDIENVQYFITKSLAAGTIGREITSFALRFVESNNQHGGSLENQGILCNFLNYNPSSLKRWTNWLCTDFSTIGHDPFDQIHDVSNLLAYEFNRINDIFTGQHRKHKTILYWADKVKKSETLLNYQLDRIYLHRNQIAHTGKFINEYSNLWSHMEWYVGKLLSYAVLKYIQIPTKSDFNKEKIFMELEADNDYVCALLDSNKNKKIKDCSEIFEKVLRHSWQFF